MEDHVHSKSCNHVHETETVEVKTVKNVLAKVMTGAELTPEEQELLNTRPAWVDAGTPVPKVSDEDRRRMERNRRKATKRKLKSQSAKPQESQERTRKVIRDMARRQAQAMRRINKLGTSTGGQTNNDDR